MGLKIPFFNRQRFIELTAYTGLHELVTQKMLTTGHIIQKSEMPKNLQQRNKLCYGYVRPIKNAVNVLTPCDMFITADNDGFQYNFPQGMEQHFVTLPHDDMHNIGENRAMVSKINMPVQLVCNKSVDFVLATNVFNFTPMHILSGVKNYSITHQLNVFNVLFPGADYFVPAFTPMLTIYPVSDLPLVFDFVFDPQKAQHFAENNVKPFFKADAVKRQAFRKKHCSGQAVF